MLETLFGGLLGGVLRLAPELLKWLDRTGERKHELALLNAEMSFARLRGQVVQQQIDGMVTMSEMNAIAVAQEEQGRTSRAAGKVIAAISALVRPAVTYGFVIAYFAVKVAVFSLAISQGGEWKEVLISIWTKDDMAILMMILSFWFVHRTYYHYTSGRS
jgi:hypothetical protein